MRKKLGIIVCLLIGIASYSHATGYQPSSFQSTSAYRATQPMSTGSFSAISASNFQALNSEGGACYTPSQSGPLKGRPKGGGGPIGGMAFQSPVGSMPWWLMLIGAGLYVLYKRHQHANP